MIVSESWKLDLLGSLLLLLLASDGSTLVLDALLSPLAGGLGLRALGVHLLLELGLASGLSLGLVDLWKLLDQLRDDIVTVVVAKRCTVT